MPLFGKDVNMAIISGALRAGVRVVGTVLNADADGLRQAHLRWRQAGVEHFAFAWRTLQRFGLPEDEFPLAAPAVVKMEKDIRDAAGGQQRGSGAASAGVEGPADAADTGTPAAASPTPSAAAMRAGGGCLDNRQVTPTLKYFIMPDASSLLAYSIILQIIISMHEWSLLVGCSFRRLITRRFN
jgi:hypothetical protein